MFGDLGHGIIMALFGIWMTAFEKKLGAKKSNNEIWNIFFGGRYIILFMGLFSCYTGFIYNDVFSKSMNIFGSAWQINYSWNGTENGIYGHNELQLNPSTDDLKPDTVYFMGLDPIWQLATNKIVFLNSYKMKLSIIFGVLHMILGL
jgi:V-type H+-transporting ATPase subunit a